MRFASRGIGYLLLYFFHVLGEFLGFSPLLPGVPRDKLGSEQT